MKDEGWRMRKLGRSVGSFGVVMGGVGAIALLSFTQTAAQTLSPSPTASPAASPSPVPALSPPRPPAPRPPALVCPTTPEALMPPLLRALPQYANRVFQRSRLPNLTTEGRLYLLFAGRVEFEPLPLGESSGASEPGIYQVFFTTRERRYESGKVANFQNFHWLFLARTAQGWRVAQMFSRIGSFPANQPPTPPFDSSEGIVAEAIRNWLTDCEAGTLPAVQPPISDMTRFIGTS